MSKIPPPPISGGTDCTAILQIFGENDSTKPIIIINRDRTLLGRGEEEEFERKGADVGPITKIIVSIKDGKSAWFLKKVDENTTDMPNSDYEDYTFTLNKWFNPIPSRHGAVNKTHEIFPDQESAGEVTDEPNIEDFDS
ncbi:unnamed protein product [Didymodactylos carnosus]|uniref:PLAT domain-containing protein n=1 Tax=Didymodactylos carnosus TaxID=1234261 RepID=A0A815BVC7_9BILA|nr:unnamed protein product [Didymodactylos carnosus]CAF1275611.1 unnamed protein product [Didymodactylos carnosus]CAF3640142.1 unnamed protein product [Didymodactylos carnosus]CAF4066747.1 unnamed protein product [Didymodactylos carnosus]